MQVANAHHSAAPHYDLSKRISLDAVVTKFEFVNPHAYVYFLAQGAGEQPDQWRCELSARAFLGRMGWTEKTFTVGQKIKINGAPARREEHVCMMTSFVRDGVEIDARQSLIGAPRIPSAASTVAQDAARFDSHPKLAGYWVAEDQHGPGARRGPASAGMTAGDRNGRPQASAAGIEAAKSYDQRFDDPALKCSPGNIIFGWTHDQNVNEIKQSDKEITLRYGYMDFERTIHMDAQHPKNIKPSLAGHSIGHWEGDDLVVDTMGFASGVLIPLANLLHSDQLHVVERFSLDANRTALTRTYRVEDPLYLKSSYSGSDVVHASNEPYTPYRCVELSGKNNQRTSES